jgi:AAA domain
MTNSLLTVESVVRATRATAVADGKWLGYCPVPGHAGKNPHLEIKRGDTQEVIFVCHSRRCAQADIVAALRERIAAGLPTEASPIVSAKRGKVLTAREWGWPAQWKRLTEKTYEMLCASRSHSYTAKLATLRVFGFREKMVKGKAVIGYPLPAPAPTMVKWCFAEVPQGTKRRWAYFPTADGSTKQNTLVYDMLRDPELQPDIFVVEGQWDCIALLESGYAAVGLLSAGQRELAPEMLEWLGQHDRVFLVPDNDADGTGKKAMEWLADSLWANAVVVELPDGVKDICELAMNGNLEPVLSEVIEGTYNRPAQPPESQSAFDSLPHATVLRALALINGEDVQDVMMDFLWPRRIPKAQMSVIAGVWDVGKGLIVSNLVAAATTGKKWLDAENKNPPMTVLYMSAEDSLKYTVVPRLKVAGADMTRVKFVKNTVVNDGKNSVVQMTALNMDLEAIRDTCSKMPEISLVVVDPISGYLGKDINQNNVADVKSVLDPLQALAEELGITIVVVGHFNKNEKQSAVFRLAGSYAFSSTPRAVWVVGRNCRPSVSWCARNAMRFPMPINQVSLGCRK